MKLNVGDLILNETLSNMDRDEKNGYIMNKVIEYSFEL